MEVQTRKRGGADDALDVSAAVKKSKGCEEFTAGCTTGGDLDDDLVDWLSLDCETMDELLKFPHGDGEGEGAPYSCSSSYSTSPVKFIENPYSSPLIFQSSCSYVTINGNEESCGSSFSDSECSVMASVDVGGAARNGEMASEGEEAREWFSGGLLRIEQARGMTAGNESGDY